MAIKRKGSLTRDRILHCAQKEFYAKGYKAAQLKSIADRAELSLGNLNYYFKKKDDLVTAIYHQFFTEIDQFIETQGKFDPLTQFAFFQFIVYRVVLRDEKNSRFYCEIIQNKSNYRVMHELIRKKYKDILEDLGRETSELDFDIMVLSEFGARHEIFLNYFDDTLSLSLDQLCCCLIRNTYKHLEIPFDTFDGLMDKARRFVLEKDFSQLRFLL